MGQIEGVGGAACTTRSISDSYLIRLDRNRRHRPAASITISLPDSLKKFVGKQLTDSGFGNVSEYFRSLLRDAQAREEETRLETLLLEGLASDRIPLDDEFRARLTGKAEQIIAKHNQRSKS